MAQRIIVYPPDDEGGRRVRADGSVLGRAFNVYDVLEFLRRAGLDPEQVRLDDAGLIDWRGGGSYVWKPSDAPNREPGGESAGEGSGSSGGGSGGR
ncbi:hypothetical protein [Streptomyces sp. ODS28]|uniref:hypothetical protein n=1 Tax=Streptomyces sp. ODS28 TaxID=3136688 RepID=UPI0031E6BCA0